MSQFPSLSHSFDIAIAAKYGIEEAILIHHFQHWIGINQRLRRHFYEERTWTYQTFDEIAAHFPYLNKSKVFDIIEKLCTGKHRKSKKDELDFEPVLIKGSFNKCKYDKTTWYAFVNEPTSILENPNRGDGKSQNGDLEIPTPIPDTIPYTKTNIDRASLQPPPQSQNFFKNKFDNRVVVTKENYDRLLEKFKDANLIESYAEKLHRWSFNNYKAYKDKKRHDMVIEDWIEKDQKENPHIKGGGLKEWIAKLKERVIDHHNIDIGDQAVCFNGGQSQIIIKFSDHSYKEQIKNRLRLMKISVDGL